MIDHIQKKNKAYNDAGFTLVEMALVLLILGLTLSAFIIFYLKLDKSLKHLKTQENIEIIADALSAFASRNYRIPCPADPNLTPAGGEGYGMERGTDADGSVIGSCTNAGEFEGIIPFRTLGLHAETLRDGWGNFFTYQVSPTFTRDPENDVPVHAKCRTLDWIEGVKLITDGTDEWYNGGRNVNPLKARFCCPLDIGNMTTLFSSQANTTAFIYNEDPNTGPMNSPNEWYNLANVLADPYDDHPTGVDGDNRDPVTRNSGGQGFYDNIIYGGNINVPGPVNVNAHINMPAYVLISHGENGLGAFLNNGTRIPGAVGEELINATANNQNVYDLPTNQTNSVNYFDDIIFWQSQSQLLARLRRDSCALP